MFSDWDQCTTRSYPLCNHEQFSIYLGRQALTNVPVEKDHTFWEQVDVNDVPRSVEDMSRLVRMKKCESPNSEYYGSINLRDRNQVYVTDRMHDAG